MVAAFVYAFGSITCFVITGVFYHTLQGPYSNGYDLAALVSLFLLSGSGVMLFAALLAIQLVRLYRRNAFAAMIAPYVEPVASTQQAESRFPQSEFARRWMYRKTVSYDENRRETRASGEQIPDRLQCYRLDPRRPQAPWVNTPKSGFKSPRKR